MTRRDLNDPAQRASYLNEVRHVGAAPRAIGLALATAGALLAVVRGYWWPAMPVLLPLAVIVAALGVMLIGIVRRIRWQIAQLRGR